MSSWKATTAEMGFADVQAAAEELVRSQIRGTENDMQVGEHNVGVQWNEKTREIYRVSLLLPDDRGRLWFSPSL